MRNFFMILVISVLLISTEAVFAQKENYNWDLGTNYVLNFDTPDGEPVILNQSIMPAHFGISSISSPDGKLLLSCNGTYAFTYVNEPKMLKTKDGRFKLYSGHGVFDWENYDSASVATQGTIILKQPGDNSNYYIFTNDNNFHYYHDGEYFPIKNMGLNYSIVDLSLENGSGQITEINQRLGDFRTTGQMIAVRHGNGKDIWVLATEDSSTNIHSYLLTENGIENKSVISATQSLTQWTLVGQMKADMNGTKIAISRFNDYKDFYRGIKIGQLELCNFDNVTGTVESVLSLDIGNPYNIRFGVEFSPNGKLLYLISYPHWYWWHDWHEEFDQYKIELLQIDISQMTIGYIRNHTISFPNFGGFSMQLAPNGKIYVNGLNRVFAINKPNLVGEECDISDSIIYLMATSRRYGLPSILIDKFNFKINPVQNSFCEGQQIILTANPNPDNPNNQYVWTAPNGTTYNGKTVYIDDAKMTDAGIYKVSMDVNSTLVYDSVAIDIIDKPKADIMTEGIFCTELKLLCSETKNGYDYLWSTGETTPIITVKEAGIYELIVKNEYGCADTADIEVYKYESEIEFDKEKLIFDELCVGETQERKINLKLVSGDEFRISSIRTNSQYFEINSSKEILKNGESAEITVTFKPQDAGKFDDELVISSSMPCEFTKSIPISASAKQVIEFSFGEHYSTAGQSLEISLFGQIKCPVPLNLTTDYEIEVAFDKEYFAPERVKFGQIISNEIVGNERVIKVKADGDFRQEKSEINVIYGRALLGKSDVSQIKIIDAKFTKEHYFAGYTNGTLKVDDCLNDIKSLKMFTPTKMAISPNPSDGELKVSIGTQEQGSFSLVVFDVQGREVFRTEFSKSDKTFKQKNFNINTQNLGNGIYTIHLTAPWTLLREQVVIIK